MSPCCPTGPGTRVERGGGPGSPTTLETGEENAILWLTVGAPLVELKKDIFQVTQDPGGAAASFNSAALLRRSQAAAEVLTRRDSAPGLGCVSGAVDSSPKSPADVNTSDVPHV